MNRSSIYFFDNLEQKKMWRMTEALENFEYITEEQADYYLNMIKDGHTSIYWEIEAITDAHIENNEEIIAKLKEQLAI